MFVSFFFCAALPIQSYMEGDVLTPQSPPGERRPPWGTVRVISVDSRLAAEKIKTASEQNPSIIAIQMQLKSQVRYLDLAWECGL